MIAEALQFEFFRRALAAALLASVACGVVGSYVVVKRMASISGGLSHAAFGGVGLAYLLGLDPGIGATVFAVGSGLGLSAWRRRLGAGMDTSIAMLWAAGMALGIVFLSFAPGYVPDLMSYLFGSILFVPSEYLWTVLALDLVILFAVIAGFRELEALCFDEEFAQVMGLSVGRLHALLMVLVALAVVTLIRIVGVILVIALLTVPAAIARQWVSTLRRMMVVATGVGAFCVTAGLFLAYALSTRYGLETPTGPLIILLALVAYGSSTLMHRLTHRE